MQLPTYRRRQPIILNLQCGVSIMLTVIEIFTVILKVADSSDTVSVCKGEKVVFECDAFNSIVQIWNPGPQNVKFGPLDNEKMQNITEDGIIKIKYTLIINKLMKNSTFRHFRSTAQLIAMKNMTMICSNGVGSGTKTKRLQLHIKSECFSCMI